MIKFFKKNWVNVVSILISVIALLISIQSNTYSKKSSNSQIQIEDIGEVYANNNKQTWYITVYGCSDDDSDGYILHFSTVGEFWVSNTGGLDTTLLVTDFASDIKTFDYRFGQREIDSWSASVYEHPNSETRGAYISLLEVTAGKGVPIYTSADSIAYFETADDAIHYFQSLIQGDSNQGLVEKRGIWLFRFSDGETYSKSYSMAEIKLMVYDKNKPNNLKGQLETSCNEMRK